MFESIHGRLLAKHLHLFYLPVKNGTLQAHSRGYTRARILHGKCCGTAGGKTHALFSGSPDEFSETAADVCQRQAALANGAAPGALHVFQLRK